MITQEDTRPSTPGTSDASNDEYSEDNTRIYFGPFKSPEKRFAAVVAIPDPQLDHTQDTPSLDIAEESSQRSSSLSPVTSTGSDDIVSVERLVGLDEDQLEDESDGRPSAGTPQPIHFPDDDEPPSALANRLLRAIDNPSPPPSPVPLPTFGDIGEAGAETGGKDEPGFSGELEAVSAESASLPPGPTAPQITGHSSISSAESEPDLMTFDDRLESLNSLSTQPASTSQLPPSPFSFPEAAATSARTTSPQAIQSFQGRTDILVDVQDDGSPAGSLVLVKQQEDEGTDSGQPLAGPSQGSEPCAQLHSDSTSNTRTQAPPFANGLPHTPLRRSSRPRKSVTPHLLNYLGSGSSDAEASPAQSTPRLGATRKSRKGKERALSPSGNDDDSSSGPPAGGLFKANEEPLNVRRPQRRYSRSPIRRESGRELGSLSPNSVDLLVSLVPSASAAGSPANPECSPEAPTSPLPTQGRPSEAEAQPGSQVGQTMQASDTEPAIPAHIARFSSPLRLQVTPKRLHNPYSPSKLRLQPVSADDPTRTPARRIPLEQAAAEGRISPQKLSQMQAGTPASVNIFTGQTMPILNMSLKADSSPARRVFVAPATRDKPTDPPQSSRKPQWGRSTPTANKVVAGTDGQKFTALSQSTKLPFPLVVAPKPQLPVEKDPPSKEPVPNGQAVSSLKQTTSRIPRKKPYSRPNAVPLAREQGAVKKASNGRLTGPVNVLEASISKKSLSRTPVGTRNEATMTTGKRVIRAVDLSKPAANKQTGSITQASSSNAINASNEATVNNNDAPVAGNLKRKRLDSKTTSVASLRSTPLRQVALDAPSSSAPSINRATASSSVGMNKAASDTKAHTTQKQSVVKFRRVIPPVPPPPSIAEGQRSTLPSLPEVVEEQHLDDVGAKQCLPQEDMVLSSPVRETTLQSPPPSSSPPTATPPPPPAPSPFVFVMDPLSPVSELASLPGGTIHEATNTRRTTRVRKPAQTQPGTDVFSSDPHATSNIARPPQRRRTNASQTSRSVADDVFAGMSMTALKALTTNNTVRNQHYFVANLETEIVRKEGARPESPAVKIKTIVQRQQEEKVRQREERAARRARRQGTSEEENASDAGYESPTFADDAYETLSEILIKHRRGAGDEEDYETPQKRAQGEADEKRRVKWDRALFTEVFLDEVVLGVKAPPKENSTAKGCLTTAAKTLRLDTLGNIIDPENPLLDLTQENIVVKKFVYDDDVEVVPQPVTPAVRNTRSKSKKGKS